jgi:N-acetylmuramoyl-L-alanine amidase
MPNFYEAVQLTPEELRARLQMQKNGTWCKFITLHNTSEPSLARWAHNRLKYSPVELMRNMESSWRALHWHTGPHYCIVPEPDGPIFELSDPSAPGVHASCFNSRSIGIEMVGEYNLEDWHTGPGAIVRDAAIYLVAALHKALNLLPSPYVYNQTGLHFHKFCVRDQHDCPGKGVVYNEVVDAVVAKMKDL